VRFNRREALVAGAAAGAALALQRPAAAQADWSRAADFVGDGDGWRGWACSGVANLRRQHGHGVLEAGSDVFPCDPRPVAFAVDQRFRYGTITAKLSATGAGAGVVLRRVGPRAYYAAILDDEQKSLLIVRRSPDGLDELARTAWSGGTGAVELSLQARGAKLLAGARSASGVSTSVAVVDSVIAGDGDPGVLATARTLFPSSGPAALPALGNVHLLPYGVQEGQAFLDTAVGQELLAQIRERSTAVFESIEIHADGQPARTPASLVAATNGVPLRRGGQLRITSDLPARVEVEIAHNRKFRRSRIVHVERTGAFASLVTELRNLRGGHRIYWRPRLRRAGLTTIGPVQTFKVLPEPGHDGQATIAVGACAAQFGPAFDRLIERQPDAFVWQGDLNYPDTLGPLAQTMSGYGGIWRDFLANPRLAPLMAQSLFAPQRDDHDYGVQDANSTSIVPWGLAPWEALMQPRLYYRFPAGHAEFWVLDQRRFKSDPTLPDTADKTLLGGDQRDWLLRTLASSHAAFKVVCSPCTLAGVGSNGRDGSWAKGFTAERDLVLKHIRDKVSGQTLFITGDTHWTMVYDKDGLFEARPCPLGIPTPNDITLTSPTEAADSRDKPGVLYADQQYSHFAYVTVAGSGGRAQLNLTLVREDGSEVFTRRFEQ
jgi:hypothetical protein